MRATMLVVSVLLAHPAQGAAGGPALLDPSDLSGWHGLEPSADVTFQGEPSARWDHARSAVARTERIPHDWSEWNCLRFALHSAEATGAKFMLILASDAETDGADYFSFPITLDWTGWQEFAIPFSEMSRARQPVGWSKIDSVTFSASGWGNEPNPRSVVHIAGLRPDRVEGPWITDTEFFEMLDLQLPGLDAVRRAVESGDPAAAKHEFAEYLRNRDAPRPKFDWKARPRYESRPEGVDTTEADRVLQRDLVSVGVYHKFEGEIDWSLNPIDYKEWPWQLNRHWIWQVLARAYWDTSDEKYAREFVYQMTDWVRKCPAPRYVSGNASYTWRTIESGIRAGQSWIEVFHRFLTSPSFTDEAIVTMVKSFAEHARQLMRWPTGGNWLAMECSGLMHVGVMFPEFKEAESWRRTAAERLYAELDRQVYPDGAQVELSTGYHQVSLDNFVAAWEIADLNGFRMPEDYIGKIGRMYDYNLHAAMPDATLPGLNDASRLSIRRSMEQALGFFPERKDYEWIATGGQRGQRPTVGSIALPFAGQLVMRTGWERDDLYLLTDAGPFGYAHQHEDALSIVVYAHGAYHIVDPGNYAYDNSQWRKYVLSTRAHNTVMVDGLDQRRRRRSAEEYVVSRPLPNRWASCDAFDYAAASYSDGYGGDDPVDVTHTRVIFFVKPEYWIIIDRLQPADDSPHTYDVLFHMDAAGARVDASTGSVHTTGGGVPNISIIPAAEEPLRARIACGEQEPVVQGWMPERLNDYSCRPIPTAVFSIAKAGETRIASVLYPTRAGEQCPVTSVRLLPSGVSVSFADGRADLLLQTSPSGGRAEHDGVETDAEAALIRMNGNRVAAAYRAGGSYLRVPGRGAEERAEPVTDLSLTRTRHRL